MVAKLLCPTDEREAGDTGGPKAMPNKKNLGSTVFRLLAELLLCNTDSFPKHAFKSSLNSICCVTLLVALWK